VHALIEKRMKKNTTKKTAQYHLHIENHRSRLEMFQMSGARWAAAAKRHALLAKGLRVTIGWDGDILDKALQTADMYLGSTMPRDNLDVRAPRLKWLQMTGAGADYLMPLDWLPKRMVLTNNSGAQAIKAKDSVAMALLMLNARLPAVLTNQRKKRWEQLYSPPIAGKTAVVIGFGRLGQAAGRAAKGLGLNVISVTRTGQRARTADLAVRTAQIDKVLPKADFVIVTAPLTKETRGLLNRDRLDLMKPSAGLVNIARAPIMDHDALCAKLENGSISGAILDVHDPEPLPADSGLWSTPNLIVLPHITCDDPDYISALLDFWFQNFARFKKGKPLKNRVDRALGY
jgi:phosphoglycerate dehydrogenase-like enzyme